MCIGNRNREQLSSDVSRAGEVVSYYSHVTLRHTCLRCLVSFLALIGTAVYLSNSSKVLAQEELLGPSPIVPVDIAWYLDFKQPASRPPAIDNERAIA